MVSKKIFSTLVFLLFICSSQLSAQASDSNYVDLFASNDHFRTGLQFKDYQIRFFTNTSITYGFRNSGLGLMLGGRKGKVGLGFTVPLTDLSTSTSNQSKRYGLNLRFYQPRYFLQLSGQSITGFQAENTIAGEELFRDDIRLWGLTFYGFKVINPHLSLRASFRNNQRQKLSQGSWLAALTMNTQTLRADSIRLLQENEPAFTINRYQQFKLGMGIGYAFTWVFRPKWYVTPVIVVGPELRWLNYRTLEIGNTRDNLRVSPRIRGRLAMGYNGDKTYIALIANWLPGYDLGKQLNTRIRDTQIRLKFGLRFIKKSS